MPAKAGRPEAAVAGALAVRLLGPRTYAGDVAPEPWFNGAASDPAPGDLNFALALYRRAMLCLPGARSFGHPIRH